MPSYQRSHSGGQAGNGTWEDRVHSLSRELDQMREQLNKTAESLRNEQIKIEAEAPGENASRSERSAYAERVNALNEKIERYNHQRRVFDEKVQAFNRQIKGDQE
jgi:chromosome segregation ATPase